MVGNGIDGGYVFNTANMPKSSRSTGLYLQEKDFVLKQRRGEDDDDNEDEVETRRVIQVPTTVVAEEKETLPPPLKRIKTEDTQPTEGAPVLTRPPEPSKPTEPSKPALSSTLPPSQSAIYGRERQTL